MFLGSGRQTNLLVLVRELSHQNGEEALALMENGLGDPVRQELGRAAAWAHGQVSPRDLGSTFRILELDAIHFLLPDEVKFLSRLLPLPFSITLPLPSTSFHSIALCLNVLTGRAVLHKCRKRAIEQACAFPSPFSGSMIEMGIFQHL